MLQLVYGLKEQLFYNQRNDRSTWSLVGREEKGHWGTQKIKGYRELGNPPWEVRCSSHFSPGVQHFENHWAKLRAVRN